MDMIERLMRTADQGEQPRKLGENVLGDWLKLGLTELQLAFCPTPQQDFMGRPLSKERALGL
jgi:hypothetical protein